MPDTEVILPGRRATDEEIPKMVRQWRKLAEENGWETQVGISVFHTPGEEYGPKAAKAGQVHGEATVTNVWIDAIHRERKARVTAAWYDEKFAWSKIKPYDSPDSLVKSTGLRAFIKGEVK